MNWHLFRSDDPNTWPEVNCPILIYRKEEDGYEWFELCKWNNTKHYFNTWIPRRKDPYYFDECYYAYIGYIPDGYKVIKTTLCGADKPCQYEDDGYCFDLPRTIKCKYRQEVNEYSLNDNKRIWKEFKE